MPAILNKIDLATLFRFLNVTVNFHYRSEAIEVFDEEEDDPSIDVPKCDNLVVSRNGHGLNQTPNTASIHDMTTSASEAIDAADHKGKMISSFVSVIEGTVQFVNFQILREINFGKYRVSKAVTLIMLYTLNFHFFEIRLWLKLSEIKIQNS